MRQAGTTTKYYWGDKSSEENTYCWNPRNAGARTWPVAQKKGNPIGLYDIVGNMSEFAFGTSGYGNRDRSAQEDCVDPKGNAFWASHMSARHKGGYKVQGLMILGANWFDGSQQVGGDKIGVINDVHGRYAWYSFIGFRVAKSRPAPCVEYNGCSYRVIGPYKVSKKQVASLDSDEKMYNWLFGQGIQFAKNHNRSAQAAEAEGGEFMIYEINHHLMYGYAPVDFCQKIQASLVGGINVIQSMLLHLQMNKARAQCLYTLSAQSKSKKDDKGLWSFRFEKISGCIILFFWRHQLLIKP